MKKLVNFQVNVFKNMRVEEVTSFSIVSKILKYACIFEKSLFKLFTVSNNFEYW